MGSVFGENIFVACLDGLRELKQATSPFCRMWRRKKKKASVETPTR